MDHAVQKVAYFIWEREGRPEGRALDHWLCAIQEVSDRDSPRDEGPVEEEEKLLAARPDTNMPALLTKDVQGG